MNTLGPKYTKYNGRPNKPRGRAIHITINPFGVIHFSQKAYAEMGRPEAATLWFDDENSKIAVMPAQPRLAEAFPFTNHDRGARLNALPFLKDFKITIDNTQKFLEPVFDAEGTAHLDLKHTTTVGRRTRESSNERQRARRAKN